MEKMLDVSKIENHMSLYCNEKAVVTVARYLKRGYVMAFSEMNHIEYLETEDDSIPFDDRIRASYSEVTIVNALRKYHGITSCFQVKTKRTIIRAIEEQIELNMPIFIILSNATCNDSDDRKQKIDFLVVGYDEEYVMGYNLQEEDTTIRKIQKKKVEEDYESKERVIVWKVVHDEVLITNDMCKKILRIFKRDLDNEVKVLERMKCDIKDVYKTVESIKNQIKYKILLENLAKVVRAKKLFSDTLKYVKASDEIISLYDFLGTQWNKVWQLFAKLSFMTQDQNYDNRLLHIVEIIVSEIEKMITTEKSLYGMLE